MFRVPGGVEQQVNRRSEILERNDRNESIRLTFKKRVSAEKNVNWGCKVFQSLGGGWGGWGGVGGGGQSVPPSPAAT